MQFRFNDSIARTRRDCALANRHQIITIASHRVVSMQQAQRIATFVITLKIISQVFISNLDFALCIRGAPMVGFETGLFPRRACVTHRYS